MGGFAGHVQVRSTVPQTYDSGGRLIPVARTERLIGDMPGGGAGGDSTDDYGY